jgi:tRNA(Ile)-lysidine synthase
MLQSLKSYIAKEKLFLPQERILLAVSGGIDSVAMAELFSRAKFFFGIAHCNFQLRGEESEKDAVFVTLLARKYKVPFFSKRFFTKELTENKNISVQMAARELRYNWFNELLTKENYQYIATAHHLDDQIETFFINMMRSTGIAGFHGIFPKQGKIIRPLLFASRNEIEEFVKKNGLTHREDTSNQEIKYLRNKIRHELLPVLSEINPGFRNVLTENIYRIREAENIFRDTVNQIKNRILRKNKEQTLISINQLKNLIPCKTYLFEFLAPFGFNYSVAEDISEALDEEAGKQFYSLTHRLIKDRNDLIIIPLLTGKKLPAESTEFHITEKNSRISVPLKLTLKKLSKDKNFQIDISPQVANLDLHKITYPLTLRKWQHGDLFYPYGRDHKKKLSDFFIDSKFSIDDKENTWILCSGGKIAWIVGHRIDNRFRITPKTKEVLQIRWIK